MSSDSTDLVATSDGKTWQGSDPRHRQALLTAKAHPDFLEATNYPFWWCDVFELEKVVIDNDKSLDTDKRAQLTTALSDVENVILVFVATATKQPQPLCGAGKSYHFLFHPQTLELLHTSTGTWRS